MSSRQSGHRERHTYAVTVMHHQPAVYPILKCCICRLGNIDGTATPLPLSALFEATPGNFVCVRMLSCRKEDVTDALFIRGRTMPILRMGVA